MKIEASDLLDAIEYTAQKTGFQTFQIEKDYYCSLILKSLYENHDLKNILIFKGGTLLSKCYFNFFRMSEDLDFSIDNSLCGNRTERKKVSLILKNEIINLLKSLNFREVSPFRGYNESTQYNGIFGYNSVVSPSETIKFEVAFRGDLLLSPVYSELDTMLENPSSKNRIFQKFKVLTLSKEEVFAEKFRAALTRKNPAIRDFFDLEKIYLSKFDIFNTDFIKLVEQKISFDMTSHINLTFEKRKILESQIETDLKPVLMNGNQYLIDNTWNFLKIFVDKLSKIS
jgi:predicted nucleotidyltransferase component of viral defense system